MGWQRMAKAQDLQDRCKNGKEMGRTAETDSLEFLIIKSIYGSKHTTPVNLLTVNTS